MPPGLTSPAHLSVIILVGLIVLGPEKLPGAIRQVGRAMAEFRRWSEAVTAEVHGVLSADHEEPEAAPVAVAVPPATAAAPVAPATPVEGKQPVPAALAEGGEWA
jgi:sec-independent protein translocase protein TatB